MSELVMVDEYTNAHGQRVTEKISPDGRFTLIQTWPTSGGVPKENIITSLHSRTLAHGFVEIEHDDEQPDGLSIQAAAHGATGYAFVPRAEVIALRDALAEWLARGGPR